MRLRARHLRIASQTLFLAAFIAAFWALADIRVRGELASALLAVDPLNTVATSMADFTVPRLLWIGLVVLGLTALLGRFFCGWLCPLGALQQLASWAGSPKARLRRERNRYRPWFAIKYIVLSFLLVWAASGSLHTGWLDPIPLLHRAVSGGVRPLWHGGASPGGLVLGAPRRRHRRPVHLGATAVLPRGLPARGAPRPHRAAGAVPDPPRRRHLLRLHPLPDGVPGGRRTVGGASGQ